MLKFYNMCTCITLSTVFNFRAPLNIQDTGAIKNLLFIIVVIIAAKCSKCGQISTVAQKGHTCKSKMLLQIKNRTCKLKIVHAN